MDRFPKSGEALGDYHVLKVLGRGGMGTVFEAEQLSLGRHVALKVISPTYADDPEFRTRFHREATLQASMDSPHIVTVYDHGEIDGTLFISTQYVGGGDLRERLTSGGPLPVDDALTLTTQIAEALGEAHHLGVVHRDVKPNNVLLRRGAEMFSYLCDFGVARVDDSDLTAVGSVVGTYGYLAPERFSGEPATPASDQYALGCLLVAALTGEAPYTGSDLHVMRQHLEGPVPHRPEHTPVDRQLNEVMSRAMAKQPAQRYPSVGAMRDDLRRVHAEMPTARGATPIPSSGHTTRRPHPQPSSTAAGGDATQTGSAPAPAPPPPGGTTAPPEPTPPLETPARRRRRLPILLAAVLAVAVAVGAGFLLLRDRDQPPQDTPASATSSPSSDAGSSASAIPVNEISCWDGRKAADRTACPDLTGTKALRWVFPSFDRNYGSCKPATEYDGKLTAYKCSVDIGTSQPAGVTYSEYSSAQGTLTHYREKYGPPERKGDRLVFGPKLINPGKGEYQASMIYADGRRWAVTAAAKSEENVLRVLDGVRMRASEKIDAVAPTGG
jgi:serine/threonine protein kinase